MRLTDRVVLKEIAQLKEPCSQKKLARQLGCDDKTVMRSVARLISQGFISVAAGGGQLPYTYEIHFDQLPEDLRRELESTGLESV